MWDCPSLIFTYPGFDCDSNGDSFKGNHGNWFIRVIPSHSLPIARQVCDITHPSFMARLCPMYHIGLDISVAENMASLVLGDPCGEFPFFKFQASQKLQRRSLAHTGTIHTLARRTRKHLVGLPDVSADKTGMPQQANEKSEPPVGLKCTAGKIQSAERPRLDWRKIETRSGVEELRAFSPPLQLFTKECPISDLWFATQQANAHPKLRKGSVMRYTSWCPPKKPPISICSGLFKRDSSSTPIRNPQRDIARETCTRTKH